MTVALANIWLHLMRDPKKELHCQAVLEFMTHRKHEEYQIIIDTLSKYILKYFAVQVYITQIFLNKGTHKQGNMTWFIYTENSSQEEWSYYLKYRGYIASWIL